MQPNEQDSSNFFRPPRFLFPYGPDKNIVDLLRFVGENKSLCPKIIKTSKVMKNFYLGIDVSKKDLAYCLSRGVEGIITTGKIENSSKQISNFLKKILKTYSITKGQLVVVAEYTGIYSNLLAEVCTTESYDLWLGDPKKMKAGFTETRGKDDMKDAKRIAEYAWRHIDQMALFKPKDGSILKLKALLRTQKTLTKFLHTLEVQLGEEEKFLDQESYQLRKDLLEPVIEKLEEAMENADEELSHVIESDPVLANKDKRAQSVGGVGPVISHYMICLTEGFTKFKTAHEFMSYCGMVPIKYESGTSVHKKTVTSNECSHIMKGIMYMPVLGFVKGSKRPKADTELHDYYVRKVEGEGKHHNCTTNVLMAKLIGRIFAVVRDDRDYLPEEEYNKKYHPERVNKEEAAAS